MSARSAERLHLSPSAISHGLGRLRTLLGDPRFSRRRRASFQRSVPFSSRHPWPKFSRVSGELFCRLRRSICNVWRAASSLARRMACRRPSAPSLLERLRRVAPGVDLGIRQLLPVQGFTAPHLAWKDALKELKDRTIDIAIIPYDDIPGCVFIKQKLYEEEFVIAARKGHSFQRNSTLKRYCEMEHLVVSHTGDASGFVDGELANKGGTRCVALTVPNFIFGLSAPAESEMVSALPRRFVEIHGAASMSSPSRRRCRCRASLSISFFRKWR